MKRILFLIATAVLSAQLSADIIYVSTSGDPMNDGSSWETAYDDVQDALYLAYPGDTIWVAAGTYYPTRTIDDDGSDQTPSVALTDHPRGKSFTLADGVSLFGGFAGNETSTEQRAKSDLNGNGIIEPWEFTNATILSADFNNDDAWTLNDDGTWNISGFGENSFHVIWVPIGFAEIPTLDGLTVQGGGCTANEFTGLNAVHKNAGGLSTSGNGSTGSDLIIQNCVFQNNYAWTNGGAMQIQNGPNTVIRGCCFRNNKASNNGGAVYNNRGTIEDCLFLRNDAKQGGAVYNNAGTSLLDRCVLASNVSGSNGGAALIGGMIKNCALNNNKAVQGGGIYLTGKGSSAVNLTVANNIATAVEEGTGKNIGGGGIFNNVGDKVITNTLFWENSLQGGLVSNSAFTNSDILPACEGCENNILIGTQSQLVNPTDFVGLANNDTQLNNILKADWHLQEGSVLINAGQLNEHVTASSLYNIPRADELPDIGAAEYQKISSISMINNDKIALIVSDGQLLFEEDVLSVELFDISGKTVLKAQNTKSLSLAGISKGLYVCVIKVIGNSYSEKILF